MNRMMHVQESESSGEEVCTVRILQTGMHDNHGGVESFILNYAQTLKDYGMVFDYVDLQGKGIAGSEKILSEGSRIFTMRDYRRHPISATKQMMKIVRKGNYACVHINMLSAASLVPVIGALMGNAKVLVHSHNSKALGLHRQILHFANAYILRKLPVTRLACGKMAGDWMFGKKDYEVIPNAIDIELYRCSLEKRHSLRTQLHIAEDTVVLGFVGRLSPQKNPVYLVKILNAVRKQGLDNVKLLIVGAGELQDEVRQTAQALGVSAHIIYAGIQTNANEWYSAMDVLLLPSLWEGLPLVGVEAQAAGLPCFISDKITDEICMTDLVHFCELTETADNWAEAILNNRNTVRDRCGYADLMASTNYSINNSTQRLQMIYRSMVTDREMGTE